MLRSASTFRLLCRFCDTLSPCLSLLVFCLTLSFSGFVLAQQPAPFHQQRDFGKVPLSFEPNRGQVDARVQYVSRGQGYALYLTPGQAILQLQKPVPGAVTGKSLAAPVSAEISTLAMKLVGANQDAVATAQEPLPGTVNYFIGSDRSKWRTALPTYKRVAYHGVYPGVDLIYYGNQRELEYDFVVSPGADAAKISLQFSGATPKIDASGDLVLAVAGGETRLHKPVVYQMNGDRKVSVEGRYQIADGKVGFALGSYDHANSLVIDPVLSYLTYLGGSNTDKVNAMAVDAAGNVYIIGNTASTDYPVSNAYKSTNPNVISTGNPQAIFVSKLNPTGTALVYSTYLGSSEYTYGNAIAIDSAGNAYVGGYTAYGDYPVTAGAFQVLCGGSFSVPPFATSAVRANGCGGTGQGDTSGVLTKLNPAGNALVYSTYLSGNNFTLIDGVAIDSLGQAYVTGFSNSNCGYGPYYPDPAHPYVASCQTWGNFPITAGSVSDSRDQTVTGNLTFVFLTKFNAAGSALLYSSILGVATPPPYSTGPQAYAVAVDSSQNAYIGGYTGLDFHTTVGAYQESTARAGVRAFVAKFDTVAMKIVYSTFITGTDNNSNVGEQVTSIAADAAGNAYVAGFTGECSFPTTAGSYQPQASYPAGTQTSCGAGFVSKLNPAGSALVWSTFLGNAPGTGLNSGGNASIYAMNLGSDGSIYVAGQTNGGGFPSVNPLYGVASNVGFISHLSADGSKLLFSTPFGSSTGAFEVPYAIGSDAAGNIYFAGQANSNSLPVTPGVFQPAHKPSSPGGSFYYYSNFVGKIAPTVTTTTTLTLPSGAITAGQTANLKAVVAGATGSTGKPTGTVTFLSGSSTLGTGTLDATGTAIFTTAALNATTYSLTASYGGDTAFASSVSAAQNLVVNTLTPVVALTAPATAIVGASVTLATTVTGTGATPTGTVTFKDGTTTIGTATLANGAASTSTTTLAVGAHSITVTYAGDSNYASATSSASTVTINVAAGISFAAAPTSLTIAHGATGSIVLTATPVGGYTGTVTFACGTLPTSASCTFAPASLTFASSNTAQTSTLSISTTTTTGAMQRPSFGQAPAGLILAALLMPFGWVVRRRKQALRSSLLLLALVCSSLAVCGLSGCSGSGSKTTTTSAGSYTVAVTITTTAGASTINVPITVQ